MSMEPNQLTRPQQRWEFFGIDGGAFRWNNDRSGWDFDDGDKVAGADDALFERLGAMHKTIGLELIEQRPKRITKFLIPFVSVVKFLFLLSKQPF